MMALIFSLPYVPLASAQTLPTPWTSIGPTPIFQSGLQVGGIGFGQGPVSGRVATIAVDPLNASHWLMGSAYGGVWETRDAGSTWIPRTDNQPTQAMGAMAFAPGNPQIVYAGTGEATGDWGFAGVGLLKSLNGGETWQLISDKFTNTSVREIKVDPQNPDFTVRLAVRQGLPQAGPWKEWPTKRAQMTDPHNNLHRAVERGTRSSVSVPLSGRQLFEEFRQCAETQQDRQPAAPRHHFCREPVLEPRLTQLTELHHPLSSTRGWQLASVMAVEQ